MNTVTNTRNEIAISRGEYEKLMRLQIAAKMSIRLLKRMSEQGYMLEDELGMILEEFGADCE